MNYSNLYYTFSIKSIICQTILYFHKFLLNLSVDFADSLLAGDLEDTISRLDRQIKQAYSKIKRIFVEAEARRVKTVAI